jgi:hypothetical protein
MALPTSYLTTVKNLDGILAAIQGAQAPEKFTQAFLESLEFKSTSDRLVIGVLKAIGFIDDSGRPKDRYFRFLDQTQSAKVLAEGIRDAYQDLFKVNTKANELGKQEVINKFKTLSQGQLSEAVLDKMAMTFTALVKLGDFTSQASASASATPLSSEQENSDPEGAIVSHAAVKLGGLVYNIQIVLPESRDPAVYDALFQSLRKHIL